MHINIKITKMEKLIKNHDRTLKNEFEKKYINEDDSLYDNIINESYLLNNNSLN